jgi:hypothetical protein
MKMTDYRLNVCLVIVTVTFCMELGLGVILSATVGLLIALICERWN